MARAHTAPSPGVGCCCWLLGDSDIFVLIIILALSLLHFWISYFLSTSHSRSFKNFHPRSSSRNHLQGYPSCYNPS